MESEPNIWTAPPRTRSTPRWVWWLAGAAGTVLLGALVWYGFATRVINPCTIGIPVALLAIIGGWNVGRWSPGRQRRERAREQRDRS